jgi:hypothetical protein
LQNDAESGKKCGTTTAYYFYKLAKALPEKYHHKNKGLKELLLRYI